MNLAILLYAVVTTASFFYLRSILSQHLSCVELLLEVIKEQDKQIEVLSNRIDLLEQPKKVTVAESDITTQWGDEAKSKKKK